MKRLPPTLLALAAWVLVHLEGPGAARAAASQRVVGRVVFMDSGREVTPDEVERARWGKLIIETRRGWTTYQARVAPSGEFSFDGPAGTYEVQYLRVGDLAEFLVPHEFNVRPNATTCVGTFVISAPNLLKELGNNKGSSLVLRDDCSALELARSPERSTLTVVAVPRESKMPTRRHTVLGLATGLYLGAGISVPRNNEPALSSWRATFSTWLFASPALENINLNVDVSRVPSQFITDRWSQPDAPSSPAYHLGAGLGYELWSLIEFDINAGVMLGGKAGPSGPGAGIGLRTGYSAIRLFGRYDWFLDGGERLGQVGVELSPVSLLGSLL
jgi:hypothetical protein